MTTHLVPCTPKYGHQEQLITDIGYGNIHLSNNQYCNKTCYVNMTDAVTPQHLYEWRVGEAIHKKNSASHHTEKCLKITWNCTTQ